MTETSPNEPEHKVRDEVSLSDSSIIRMHDKMRHHGMPTRDEAAGLTVGGALGIVLVWWLEKDGGAIPAPVAAALGTVAAQVVHYLASFLPRRR